MNDDCASNWGWTDSSGWVSESRWGLSLILMATQIREKRLAHWEGERKQEGGRPSGKEKRKRQHFQQMSQSTSHWHNGALWCVFLFSFRCCCECNLKTVFDQASSKENSVWGTEPKSKAEVQNPINHSNRYFGIWFEKCCLCSTQHSPKTRKHKCFEGNAAVIQIIDERRSSILMHVVRAHRADLDCLFEGVNKDDAIFIWIVPLWGELADLLTTGGLAVEFHVHRSCFEQVAVCSTICWPMAVDTITTVDVFWLDLCGIIIPEQAQGRPIANQERIEKIWVHYALEVLEYLCIVGHTSSAGRRKRKWQPITDPGEDELQDHIRDPIVEQINAESFAQILPPRKTTRTGRWRSMRSVPCARHCARCLPRSAGSWKDQWTNRRDIPSDHSRATSAQTWEAASVFVSVALTPVTFTRRRFQHCPWAISNSLLVTQPMRLEDRAFTCFALNSVRCTFLCVSCCAIVSHIVHVKVDWGPEVDSAHGWCGLWNFSASWCFQHSAQLLSPCPTCGEGHMNEPQQWSCGAARCSECKIRPRVEEGETLTLTNFNFNCNCNFNF